MVRRMSGSSWNFAAVQFVRSVTNIPWRGSLSWLSGSRCELSGAVDGDRVAFDGDHERGEVAVADDSAELLFGDEHAGGGPALAHVAALPAFDVALGVADDLDHRLARVRRREGFGELAGDPESHQRQRLAHPLTQRGGRVGPAVVEFTGEQLQSLFGQLSVG